MAIMVVTYDLRKPDRNYQSLYDYLKTFNYCWHIESVWMLDTDQSAVQIRDGMRAHVEPQDRIFVARLMHEWAALNYDCSNWLNDSSRTW